MKRKKWSEVEEQTLLSKYSDLVKTNTLPKLKTREKKFKPIAEHVNSLHHNLDPIIFPFKWSWRDVSIKVQNMRHQYLNVKQKIKICNNQFNWEDGLIHWENFLKYKQVFGDVELSSSSNNNNNDNDNDEFEFDGSEDEIDEDDEEVEKTSLKKVLELREVIVRREEKRREKDEEEKEREEMRVEWAKREVERWRRMEREFEEERKRKMRLEERWETEEMEWRERMVEMEMEHERRVMRMQADACQNQLQIIGMVGRVLCQFFGSGNDGLGLGTTQVLQQQQQQQGGLAENGKADGSLPSEFL